MRTSTQLTVLAGLGGLATFLLTWFRPGEGNVIGAFIFLTMLSGACAVVQAAIEKDI